MIRDDESGGGILGVDGFKKDAKSNFEMSLMVATLTSLINPHNLPLIAFFPTIN